MANVDDKDIANAQSVIDAWQNAVNQAKANGKKAPEPLTYLETEPHSKVLNPSSSPGSEIAKLITQLGAGVGKNC